MIKVYLLPTETKNNIERVKGNEHIHDALLETTETPNVRKLVMDTGPDEDITLSALALETRAATLDEIKRLNDFKAEIASTSPARNLAKEIDELKAEINKLKVRR
jgi:hypothetical protein